MCRGRRHRGWKHQHPKHRREQFLRHHGWVKYPPVNIEEFDDRYELNVFAAGYAKEEIAVNVKDNWLVVSAEKKDMDLVDLQDMRKQELQLKGFERTFEMNDKIDKEKISAAHKDGVLKVTLQKLEGTETYRQDIDIV